VSGAGPPSSGGAARILGVGVRDLLLWSAAWAVYLLVIQPLTLSEDGIAIVWMSGGLVAGLLIVLPVVRWWPVLVPTVAALAIGYTQLSVPDGLALFQVAVDVIAVLAYAAVIRRHRRDLSGLGADIAWVAFGAVGTAAVRVLPMVLVAAAGGDAGPSYAPGAVLEAGLSTVVGFVAGTATVLGMARWRWREARVPQNREAGLGSAVLLAVLVLVLFTPFGTAVPGSQYLIVPLLLASAVRYPVPLTAFLTGVSVLAVSLSASQYLGAYAAPSPASVQDVFETQVYLLVLTASVFVLASVVSERRMALSDVEHSSAMLAAVFRESPVPAAWVTLAVDSYPVIREANPAFLSLVGLPGSEVRGVRVSSLLSPTDPADVMSLESGRDLHVIGLDGNVRWLRPTLSGRFSDPAQEDSGRPSAEYAVLVLEDVTADRVSEELLRQQARRDSLTGLPNRAALVERLEEALLDSSEESPCGLLIVDIDDLKVVNNGLGHLAGDQLIIQMAQRFSQALGPRDFLVRTGGDEFAVLRPRQVAHDTLDDLAERMLSCVLEPFMLDNRPVSVSVSIGAAESDAATEIPGDLLRASDIALQRAKHGGRRQTARFEPGEDRPAIERMGVEELLRRALEGRQLVCLFQPIVLASNGRVVAAETLVRLRDGNGDLVAPAAFLPLAAELGLLGELTDQVLEQAFAAAREWLEAGHEVRVAFNAPPQWLNSTAIETVEAAAAAHRVPLSVMTVEVTEEETLSAGRTAVETLTELRSRGMHVAIDDFGTGYAGLDSFRSVPADIVKVDRSFIDDMLRNDEDYELVRSMLDLVYRFGKLAVAEGVETEEQLVALRAMGCEYGQGFYLSRPVPFEAFPAGQVLPAMLPTAPV
jgi:diguanylate cyclase (GGDEF)-like protein